MYSWINIEDHTPISYETGNWDGKRSSEVVAQDENGKNYIARIYEGRLDGCEFKDWVDDRDDHIDVKITRWISLPN